MNPVEEKPNPDTKKEEKSTTFWLVLNQPLTRGTKSQEKRRWNESKRLSRGRRAQKKPLLTVIVGGGSEGKCYPVKTLKVRPSSPYATFRLELLLFFHHERTPDNFFDSRSFRGFSEDHREYTLTVILSINAYYQQITLLLSPRVHFCLTLLFVIKITLIIIIIVDVSSTRSLLIGFEYCCCCCHESHSHTYLYFCIHTLSYVFCVVAVFVRLRPCFTWVLIFVLVYFVGQLTLFSVQLFSFLFFFFGNAPNTKK